MTDTARLEAQVGSNEGFAAVPAKDTRGLWSVAEGWCLETNPPTGEQWRVLLENGWVKFSITKAGADWAMGTTLVERIDTISKLIPEWDLLNDARQNALVEMAFQLGVKKFLGFHDMLGAIPAAIKTGDWSVVKAEALDSDWNRELLKTHSHRAEIVAEQLASGEFPHSAPGAL